MQLVELTKHPSGRKFSVLPTDIRQIYPAVAKDRTEVLVPSASTESGLRFVEVQESYADVVEKVNAALMKSGPDLTFTEAVEKIKRSADLDARVHPDIFPF